MLANLIMCPVWGGKTVSDRWELVKDFSLLLEFV